MTRDGKGDRQARVPQAPTELPIVRDFFVDPRLPRLPASYGDDRVLTFLREPVALVVSWDLSAPSYAQGQPAQLEVLEPSGRLVVSRPIEAASGLLTFEGLPMGTPLVAQAVVSGRVVARGTAVTLGTNAWAPAPHPAPVAPPAISAPAPAAAGAPGGTEAPGAPDVAGAPDAADAPMVLTVPFDQPLPVRGSPVRWPGAVAPKRGPGRPRDPTQSPSSR